MTEPTAQAPPFVAAVDPATKRTLAAGQAKAARETADRDAAARTIAAAAKASPAAGARKGGATASDDAAETPRTRRGRAELAAKRARDRAGDAEEADAGATRGRNGKVEFASRTSARGKAGAAAKEDVKPRTAAERRAADKKSAAESAKKDRGEATGRFWVQVAGGAEERDLPKAWTAAQKKAAALKGREAYSTPLRATNRVVTGPFKTAAEARAFVNQLAKQGVSAFQFTSAAGQKMTKLSAR